MPRKMAREPKGSASNTVPSAKDAANETHSPASCKIDLVIDLLRREEGATLAELTEATGWLPHSVRAVLTGLRKKEYRLERSKRGEVSCYRIVSPA